jgi:hypothetical protein
MTQPQDLILRLHFFHTREISGTFDKRPGRDAKLLFEIAREMRRLFVAEVERDFLYAVRGFYHLQSLGESKLTQPIRNSFVVPAAEKSLQGSHGYTDHVGQRLWTIPSLPSEFFPCGMRVKSMCSSPRDKWYQRLRIHII